MQKPNLPYDTTDELNFIRELHAQGKRKVLLKLRVLYRHRDWRGKGMEVNGEEVLRELDRLLGKAPAGQVEAEDRSWAVMWGLRSHQIGGPKGMKVWG